jgi:RNAse (barnase) inhibitor barstar
VNSRRVEQELLFNPDGPALSLLVATPSDVANLLMVWTPAHPEWDVLRVRGTKSSDEARFFDELAAALQFPYYFGENWDAVWDCITDLNWLRGLNYLVIFDSAEYLLSESDRGFQGVVQRAHRHACPLASRDGRLRRRRPPTDRVPVGTGLRP